MGIINCTPDSFFESSRAKTVADAIAMGEKMLDDGAFILDIGGQSTRPEATRIDAATEEDRVLPVIEGLLKRRPSALLSIDTFYASVAQATVNAGACMVNDVSAGNFDEAMLSTVAQLKVPYVLMHMQGEPSSMHIAPQYTDVVQEVIYFLSEKLEACHKLGINDVILDPGFGFGKTREQNYTLLRHLSLIEQLHCPILAGLSRKKMVQSIENPSPEDALTGTIAANMLALQGGATFLRVHDVAEALSTIRVFEEAKKRKG